MRVAADPVFDDAHQVTGAVLIITDITVQKRVEEAMLRSNQELLQANRIKDEFLATLSHELRTPLNAIVGWIRLLRAGRLDDRGYERALETIDRNATLQAKLVEDLLDGSRIITGKLRLRLGAIDPVSVIEASINSVRPAAELKGITVESELESGGGLVTADGDRLQQVMWNLLSNAIKFTPAGGRVRVRMRRTGDGLVVEVADDGAGIEPQFLPYVFDRFRQADASTTRSHGGLGLGLAIVRHLIELHGGVVSARSDGRGRGAAFTITLPWTARPTARRLTAPVAPATEAPATAATPDALDHVGVLIVDDEDDARELLAAAFAQMGATVQLAANADAALAAIARQRPDVVVSDIGMPGEDGYSLLRRLRACESGQARLPAIALTAYATKEDVARALSAGYDLHVAKPVNAAQLARTIVELLATPSVAPHENTAPIALADRQVDA
jgi:signal transduction histidine kinase/CheY-like chemotaxis protein